MFVIFVILVSIDEAAIGDMEKRISERKIEGRRRTEDRRNQEMSADAGIRTRVLTLARLSDNQLHYVHTGKAWIHSSNIKITECAEPCPRSMSMSWEGHWIPGPSDPPNGSDEKSHPWFCCFFADDIRDFTAISRMISAILLQFHG